MVLNVCIKHCTIIKIFTSNIYIHLNSVFGSVKLTTVMYMKMIVFLKQQKSSNANSKFSLLSNVHPGNPANGTETAALSCSFRHSGSGGGWCTTSPVTTQKQRACSSTKLENSSRRRGASLLLSHCHKVTECKDNTL